MPATINPIRKALLKKNLLAGQSAIEAQKNAGWSPGYAHRSTCNPAVKSCMAEILPEINRPELVKKAYRTLDDNLTAPERPVQIAASQTILRYTVGEIHRIEALPEADRAEFQSLRKIVVDITPKSDEQ